jgi:hypothetical protein
MKYVSIKSFPLKEYLTRPNAPRMPKGVEIRATIIATGRLTLKKEVVNVGLLKKEINHLNDIPSGGKRNLGDESKEITTMMKMGAKRKL